MNGCQYARFASATVLRHITFIQVASPLDSVVCACMFGFLEEMNLGGVNNSY